MFFIVSDTFFNFYDLPISFYLDESKLKKVYYSKMRSLHPDMNISASAEEKERLLLQSSYNNEAYNTLRDFYKRLAYIISIVKNNNHENIEGAKKVLPPSFLMEMMDVNEEIMELQFDYEPLKAGEIKNQVESQQNVMLADLENEIKNIDLKQGLTLDIEEQITNFLLKRNYLLRILENLDKFAPQS